MKIHKINAILKKTTSDMLKNKRVFMFFFMFPAMTYLFYNIMPSDAMPEQFPIMFLPMHIIFASLSTISGLIAEEKDKGTLKSLMFANVKPIEYFFGVGAFVFLITILTSLLFIPLLSVSSWGYLNLFIAITFSSICSMILGAVIGLLSPNEMTANGIGAPITIFLGMMPMIGMFDKTFYKISLFLYTTRFSDTVASPNTVISWQSWLTYGLNFVVCLLIFTFVYKKRNLNN